MNNSEIFLTQKPQSEILRKYISYYYFHQWKDENQMKKIVFYPNIMNALTIYKNSYLVFEDAFISTTKFSEKGEFNNYYSGIKRNLASSEMLSPFDKIGIVFEPLGINYFIKKNISEILSNNDELKFNEFETSMNSTLNKVYSTENTDEKVKFLDDFFLSQLNNFKDEILEKSLELIQENNQKYKVSDLASKLKISQKTLNRKFQKHLNCSVKDYLEVSQFRKSFNHFLSQNQSEKLTDLAYQFDYYDQSEFIKQFKKITGINPKKLFKSVERFGEEEIFWNTKT